MSSQRLYRGSVLIIPMLSRRELKQRYYGLLKVTKLRSDKARVGTQAVQLQELTHLTAK